MSPCHANFEAALLGLYAEGPQVLIDSPRDWIVSGVFSSQFPFQHIAMMKCTVKQPQYWFLPRYSALGLVLTLGLAACATPESLSTVVSGRPDVTAIKTAPADVPTTALVAAPPQTPKEIDLDTSDKDILLTPDRLTSIYFPLGAHSLDREAEAKIKSYAEKLMANPRLSATLIGHTDDLGSKEYNDALCIKRAVAVKQMLLDLGVAAKQLRLSIRYGYETPPPKPCLGDACRKKMRRVEVLFDNTAPAH